MKRLLILSVITAGLGAAADLMPLSMGNYWVYREDLTGETFTIRVGQPVALNSGKNYHYLIGYTTSPTLARTDQAGNLVAFDQETGEERLLAGLAQPEGMWWPAPGRECTLAGQTQGKRVQHEGPGGRWQGVLVVNYQSSACADAGTLSEEFAENIGLLRRTVSTLAGPRTFNLIYARVGTQIIETQNRGRFSVAVDEPAGAQALRVTLRIDLGFTPFIRLRFPTSQQFELVLRDGTGQIVWRWSDGRFFDQAVRVVLVGNVWSQTVLMPKPVGDLTGYTVEGWLTTLPDEPKFAATAPIPPPRLSATSDRVASIVLSSQAVRGGEEVTARVTLEGPAPNPAVTLFLGTGAPLVAQVPVVVYVPGGQTATEFKVTTARGVPPQQVTISASSGGKTAITQLRIN